MQSRETKFQSCADIALEAERLLEAGERAAAQILHRRVAETCVFGPRPCPANSDCAIVVARVARELAAND